MKNNLQEKISSLRIDNKLKDLLVGNGIENINELCNCTRINLSKFGCTHSEINEVSIKLQLMGLDLKRNYSKRNSLID